MSRANHNDSSAQLSLHTTSTMDNHDAAPLGTVPEEKVYTKEKLAELQAVMMEELGIARVKSLPLDDGGAPVEALGPLQPLKKHANPAIAAWQNARFDGDDDPTKVDLDDIAGGQLYRLRQNLASSVSRGHSAPRGGHRGGGRGNRGGRGGRGGQGFPGPGRPDDRPYPSSSTPKKFMNDARLNVHGSAHLDLVQARLRGPAPSVNSSTDRQAGHGPAGPPLQNQQPKTKSKARAQSSRPLNLYPANSTVKVVDDDVFLKWAGIGEPASAKPPATPKSVGSDISRTQPTPSHGPSHLSTPVFSTPSVVSPAQGGPSTGSLGNQGLAASRRGPSRQQVVQPSAVPAHQQKATSQDFPAARQQPAANSPRMADLVFAGSIVTREMDVKYKKNNAPVEKKGVAALTKEHDTDELYTLELFDALTGSVLVSEAISHDAVFEVQRSTITYRAGQHRNTKPPTWTMRFPLPMYADCFAKHVIRGRSEAGVVARALPDKGLAPSNHSASLKPSSYSAPEAIDTPTAQEVKTGEGHAQMLAGASQVQYHAGYELGDRRDLGVFAEEVAADHVETLIALGSDEETYTPLDIVNSDMLDLLEGVDDDIVMVDGLLDLLGGGDEFLDKTSIDVVAAGGKPVHDVSSDQFMTDPVYESAVRQLIARFLSDKTQIFGILNRVHPHSADALVEDQSRKIMELAISRRDRDQGSRSAIADRSTIGSELVEEKMSTVTKEPSIKYSPGFLRGLRDRAVDVKISEQPARERRSSTVVSPLPTAAPPVTATDVWQAFGAANLKSAAESCISTANVASTTPSTAATPTEVQHTNDALWDVGLASEGSHTPVVKSEPKVYKGLNIHTSGAVSVVEPTTPIVEQSMASPATENFVRSNPKASLMHHGQILLLHSVPAVITPATRAMQDKITAALKQASTASPGQSPASSIGRRPDVGVSMDAASVVSAAVQSAELIRALEEKSDQTLKIAPGLSASKWADRPEAGSTPIENVRPSRGHRVNPINPNASGFPARPTQQHQSSFRSHGSENKINPIAPAFKPPPQHPHASSPVEQRPALSPRREGLQSQLQSRLNNSMTGPRMSY